ncbi:MAG: tryptophan synthase subunit alpha [Saprospiraceae bacterium]|nr:tryptophan synthase subunit alpha [Saprospiraceae bacterium]
MNRLDQLFQEKQSKILAVYFTAGFPQLNDTRSILKALQNGGADIIEIGMPFSDPLADGEVIQQSSAVALRNGMTIERLFNQLEGVREEIHVPLVLMGYLNPVLQYGLTAFLEACVKCGIDGLILPDLPVEAYEAEYKAEFESFGIYPIFLVTPKTPAERIKQIATNSKGFLYVVSSATTTGATGQFSDVQKTALANIAALQLDVPLMAGFGIHDNQTFLDATAHARGGIVGSAFIKMLQKEPSIEQAVQKLMEALNR